MVILLALGVVVRTGEASHPPLPGAPVEDPRGDALRGFRGALERSARGTGLVRILHIGDSHVAGDVMTGALRETIQGRFGDGGPGLVVPGSPWPRYRHRGVETGGSGWTAVRITRAEPEEGPIGITGVVMVADEPGATAWVASRAEGLGAYASQVELHYLRAPGGGRLQVLVDGQVRANLGTGSNRFEPAFWSAQVEDGAHRVDIVATGGGTVRVLGVSLMRATGVVYDALGVNGARWAHWQRADPDLLAAEIGRVPPALFITTFGTNETDDDDRTAERHREAFLATLSMLRAAAPGASCLVMGPPDRAVPTVVHRRRSWETTRALASVIAASRQAALESGCGFWNTYQAMGGRGTIRRWALLDPPLAGDDRIHLTSGGYRLVAEAFASALLETR